MLFLLLDHVSCISQNCSTQLRSHKFTDYASEQCDIKKNEWLLSSDRSCFKQSYTFNYY